MTIGSRDSELALIQTNLIKSELEKIYPGIKIEIKKIKTQGDQILDLALSKIGDKGLFVKELENALLDETIDLAVHSMKDLPTALPDGLEIAATSRREDVRDVVCMSQQALSESITDISQARIIGTSSPRRIAQLTRKYPHIKFVDIRGNLNTRFRKLDDISNNLDGIVLAAAGIKRIARHSHVGGNPRADLRHHAHVSGISEGRITQYLDPLDILPAVGQGALAVEIKSSRTDVKEIVSKINSPIDETIIKGERAFLKALEGGCQVPIGIYTQLTDATASKTNIDVKLLHTYNYKMTYTGMIADYDGENYIRETVEGGLLGAELLGEELAKKLRFVT